MFKRKRGTIWQRFDGTAGNDDIDGTNGDDLIYGYGGNDFLIGWDGQDSIFGGIGNDELQGRTGADFLYGDEDSDLLDGGSGVDRLSGGDGVDFLSGGTDAEEDVVDGGAGNDWVHHAYSHDRIDGGDGDDSFYVHQLNGLTDLRIEGGAGYDIFYLNARLEDILIEVAPFGTQGAPTTYVSGPGMAGIIELHGVEKIVAAEVDVQSGDRSAEIDPYAIGNSVATRDRPLTADYQGAIIAEMADLARIAYQDDAGLSPPRNWRAFEAIALGMPTFNNVIGGVNYRFVDGIYHVETNPQHDASGEALVLFGIVNGVSTIVVAFRGTDQKPADFFTYDFSENYKKFCPLIDAVKEFALANDIGQILLTGHSLGAALAQTALGESFADETVWGHVRAFAFASPGGDRDQADDVPADRIVTFNRFMDDVPGLASIVKETAGPIVEIQSVNFRPAIAFQNHSPDVYVEDLVDLSRAAADASNAGFYAEDFAIALRTGAQWDESLGIVLGNDADNVLLVADQRYAVAGRGQDRIVIDPFLSNPQLLVDGGGGDDRVALIAIGPVTQVGFAEDFHLFVGGVSVGRFVGIESYLVNGQLRFSNGRTVTVQTPSAGAATFALLSGYDMADAGDGALTVIGTGNADTVAAGLGDKTIEGRGGDDILFVRDGGEAAAGDRVTLDGGAGTDLMIGGAGDERLIVDQAGDTAVGGGGIDTVEASISYVLPDDVENLLLLDGGADGTGNALDNDLRGNGAANGLYGGAGNDQLFGFDGDDRLEGGEGADRLSGENGSDQMTGGAGNDLIDGGDGNDVIAGGLGNDSLWGGTGADIFVFEQTGDSRLAALRSDGVKFLPDRIGDFVSGEDRIDLSAIDAKAATGANDAFTFIGAAAFTGQAGQLRYDLTGGVMRMMGDVDGDGRADFEIVAVTPILQATDFIL
jgi:Ca2+-binding RTX toxin-like protein